MQPDAINFWMGSNRSITSTHKDPYENLYAVVRGSKTFTLFPPTCVPFMPYALFSLAKYERVKPGLYDIVDVRNDDDECDCGHCCTNENEDQGGQQNSVDILGRSATVNGTKDDFNDQIGLEIIETVLNEHTADECGHHQEEEQFADLNGPGNVHTEATKLQNLLEELEMLSSRDETTVNESELENLRVRFETVCGKGATNELNDICFKKPSGLDKPSRIVQDPTHKDPSSANSPCRKEPNKIPWIACNPLKKDSKYQNFFDNAKPVVATLYPGDLLYLPSLWFHHVQQVNGTVAVNYWYDMSYDAKYVYFKFLEKLSQPHLNNL